MPQPLYPKIKNTNEKDTYRNENGIVTTAGSLNFTNTTGRESISLDIIKNGTTTKM